MRETWKIAIVGAASLRGKELNEALSDSAFSKASIILLDEESEVGRLEASGDEATLIQRIDHDSFEHVDFAFFCSAPEITLKHWREAVAAGTTIIDLSNALEAEDGSVVCAPWLEDERADLSLTTKVVIPAHAVSLALALMMTSLETVARLRFGSATVLEPASEYGSAAIDELHQQTVSLLNFQSLPKDLYGEQVAFNVVPSFGESPALGQTEARIRHHYAAIRKRGGGSHMADLGIQVVHVPVFHGVGLSIALEFDEQLTRDRLGSALAGKHVELIPEDVEPPNNLSSAGQPSILARLRPQNRSDQPTDRFWIWASFDNLKLSSLNAIACAMDLRRLRPKGKVQ